MNSAPDLGFSHFIAQADGVGRVLLVVLLVMSLLSWYVIATRGIQRLAARRRRAGFLRQFWAASSVDEAAGATAGDARRTPYGRVLDAVMGARQRLSGARVGDGSGAGAHALDLAGGTGEYLTRTIRQALEAETARAESGLTALATVGATAPFVGLFGTVWGVYRALVAIGQTGAGTLDKVAGPVGEALIMTGIGLGVAIPAVIGYNILVRSNRIAMARLDDFGHDLYSVLMLGERAAGASAQRQHA